MTILRSGGPIRVGDPTSGGGQVIGPGVHTMPIHGKPAITRGMYAICCGGPQVFVEGCYRVDAYGRGLVLQGHKLSCGHHAISTCPLQHHIDDAMPGNYFAPNNTRAAPDGSAAPLGRQPAALHEGTTPHASDTPVLNTVTVHLGLFFDGTRNNAANVQAGAQCRGEVRDETDADALQVYCDAYRNSASYEGAPTNVAKLHDLFRDSAQTPPGEGDDQYYIPLYIDGIGTTAGQRDSLGGVAMGTGPTGVRARAEQVLDQTVREALDRFAEDNPDVLVEHVVLYVFGFSRGAAAARHFVNLVNEKGVDLCDPLANCGALYVPGFHPRRNVRIAFVGLFDTVVNVALSSATGDPDRAARRELRMALPEGCADKVVQLCAHHEHRVNFPLTLAGPPHHDIRMLPGAHSDIGGGYRDEVVEELMMTRPVGYDEPMGLAPEKSRAYREADRAKVLWRTWLDPEDPDAELRPDARAVTIRRRDLRSRSVLLQPRQRVYATVRIRRKVSAAYTRVCLRVMHAVAEDAGVPLDFIDDNDPAMALPDELKPISDKLIAYARSGDYALTREEERLLRCKYLHLSAHWQVDLPDAGPGPWPLRALYISRPTDDYARVVYSNQGGRTE